MGTGCCNSNNEQNALDTQICTEPIRETTNILTGNMKTINDIKVMVVHRSKENVRVKPKPRPPIKTNNAAGSHLAPEDPKEMLGLLEPGLGLLKVSQTILRCPTNFKVEPLHFRGERSKQSLEDRYVIEDVIGKGSFGEVKKIKEKFTGLYKALKVISKGNCQKTDNFADEIEIIKKLDHPNIVRFYEFYQDDNYYYLITEFCEGGDLLAKIQTLRTLPEGKAARILRQILSATDMCHKKNIVHRDLKPENILFEGSSVESTVKVIDFGRSKLLTPTQKIMERAGSLFYMAPEVLQCKEYNQQCDIWSAGVLLYLLLSGAPPFHGKTREETVERITEGNPQFKEPAWRRISPEAKEFLKKLLRYVPEERPTASEALKDPWIRKYSSMKGAPQEELLVNLENLRSFRTQMTLQKAVLSYIASQELSKAEEEKLKEAFDSIDTDKNGRISKEELVEAYVVLHGNEGVAKIEAHRVMTRIDINQNGTIDYNEFLMANLAVQNALSEERLKKAFEFFDSNKDGAITMDELRKHFGMFCGEDIIKKLMSEADMDKDGKISLEDFMKMMKQYIDTHILNLKKNGVK